jgi:hypothetical protein
MPTLMRHRRFLDAPSLLGMSSDDTYFADETSKLYFGRVEKDAYATDINAFYPTGTNQAALDCIFQQLGE